MSNSDNTRAGARTHGADQTNSAPSASTPEQANIAPQGAFEQQRAFAASLYECARNGYLAASRDAAVAGLKAQFPFATLAVFERASDRPDALLRLARLEDGEQTIRLNVVGRPDSSLTPGQSKAVADAEQCLRDIEKVDASLEPNESGFESWDHYNLDLTWAHRPMPGDPHPMNVAGHVVEGLTSDERKDLYSELSELAGQLPSMVDTDEIEWSLQHGRFDQPHDHLPKALKDKFGSFEAAALAVSESGTWSKQCARIIDVVESELHEAIVDAAQAVLDGTD